MQTSRGGAENPRMFTAIAAHPWAYPALEVAHLIGIALLLGNLVLLELRVLGAAPDLPLPALARAALTLVLTGFGLPDDNLHAPNEKLHLPTWYRGIDALINFFYNLEE